jgi:deoxyribodipyrimidine photo-lyase
MHTSRKINFKDPGELPDIFTTYRKSVEPLHERPLNTLPRPKASSLPAFPNSSAIPEQPGPFTVPRSQDELLASLTEPVKNFMPNLPIYPEAGVSGHPFRGGEVTALGRLVHLIQTGGMKDYKDTRNGLVGTEYSTKLSAYLAQGCLTARQVHEEMVAYESGTKKEFSDAPGFGGGENEGTKAVRFELLWRDYMRLCTRKFQHKLFRVDGFRGDEAGSQCSAKSPKWKTANEEDASPSQDPLPARIAEVLERFNAGTTGMGLIDASQREVVHTGYTSNRARQNVASFLSKHIGIDWRYGAEWYEMLLIDYDVSSNWANWQYVAGVGNDPRGEARIFNPVKQAFDYDKEGKYVRMWVTELKDLEKLENVFQAWTTSPEELKKLGLQDNIMITDPIKRIDFSVEGKPSRNKNRHDRRRGEGRRPSSNATAENKPSKGRVGEVPAANGNGHSAGDGIPGQQGQNGQPSRPSQPAQTGQTPGGFRGGFRGRGFRGQRGFSTGMRGGFRGRYAPGPGRPVGVTQGQAGA